MVSSRTAKPIAARIIESLPTLFKEGEVFRYQDLAAVIEASPPSVSTALLIVAEKRLITRVGPGVYAYRTPTEEEYANRRVLRHKDTLSDKSDEPQPEAEPDVMTLTVVARPYGKILVTDGSQLFLLTSVDLGKLV